MENLHFGGFIKSGSQRPVDRCGFGRFLCNKKCLKTALQSMETRFDRLIMALTAQTSARLLCG